MSTLPSVDCDVLIVRGASSTDDLQVMGLPMAERYERAWMVVLVPESAPARIVKHVGGTVDERARGNVSFVDADSRIQTMFGVLERIKSEYASRHPDKAHLAHCIVGLFLFYYGDLRGDRAELVSEMITRGDIKSLERAAEKFISTDFGSNRSPQPSDMLSCQDGDSRDPSRAEAVDVPPASVSGADG